MTHYITRAVLDRHAPEHALKPLLDPVDANAAFDAHRRLIWTLFPGQDTKRDFLWRADGRGKFLIVSARQPQDSSLFKPLESKVFAPVLETGDRLAFVLRANATRDRRSGSQDSGPQGNGRNKPRRDRRVDVVMHAMQEMDLERGATGPKSRAAQRMGVAGSAAKSWFENQGERRGFQVNAVTVEDYRVLKIGRRGNREATFGVLDLKGLLTVRDPEAFTNTLFTGLGRGRAFGCGLMLAQRA